MTLTHRPRPSSVSLFPAFLLLLVSFVVGDENVKAPPPGHLQKLGSHRPAEGDVQILTDMPHPLEFFERFVQPHIPVVLKGAAKTMPAYRLWTDAYLKEKSGKERVAIEPGKKENRTRVQIEGTSAPFGEFLDIYNTSDIYMVDDVPAPIKCKE